MTSDQIKNETQNGAEHLHTHDPLAAPSTVANDGTRIWLYPDRRDGFFAKRRKWIAAILIVFYLFAPYITINGEAFLRFDVLASRISIFTYSFRYTDGALVFFVLALLSLTLFLVTSLRGRIWCGYACPQTVFIDWVIRPIEELVEGNYLERKKLDQSPFSFRKFRLKFIKQTLFLVIAAVVANTFLAYFIDYRLLAHWITRPPSEHPTAFFFMSLVMGAFYFDLGWFREQFCCFLCPYARFQSILTDKFSPIVGYDKTRGEPRGKAAGSGDCINCGLCVRVCPTGIDIRNGLQLECINCERCMDACDSIMSNLKRPTGLIRIASQAEFLQQAVLPFYKRPRVLVYSMLISIVLMAFLYVLVNRNDVNLTLVRAPGQAFARMEDGKLSNMFQVHVESNRNQNSRLEFKVLSPEGAQLICGGCEGEISAYQSMRLNLVVLFDPKHSDSQTLKLKFEQTGEILEAPLLSDRPQ